MKTREMSVTERVELFRGLADDPCPLAGRRNGSSHREPVVVGEMPAIEIGPATPPAPSPLSAKRARAKPARSFDTHTYVFFGLVFVTAFLVFAALRLGWEYYLMSLTERPNHWLHEVLRPSGLIGHGFGIVGGLFCVLTLLYPLRKRWRLLENAGTPRHWFQYHVYFGIAGPMLVTLHTAFKFGGVASISYWSMMLVMVSGFVGRFLFSQLPRSQRGLALSLQEIDREIGQIRNALYAIGFRDKFRHSLPNAFANELKCVAVESAGWTDLVHLWMIRRRHLRLWNQWLRQQGFPPSSVHRIVTLLSRRLFMEGSLVTLELATRAFSHWHSLHVPLTFVMLATLVAHVGLTILFGYSWIF